MENNSFKTYGVLNLDHLKQIARDISNNYSYGANKDDLYKMLLETAIVETNAGQAVMDIKRKFGRSIMQFDEIGYKEALRMRNLKANKDFQNDVDAGYMSDNLQLNPEFAMYLARFYYLSKNDSIPSSLEGRAAYWKKYYNTVFGAGNPTKYIQLIQTHLGKDWK